MAFAHRLLGKTCFSAWLVPFRCSVFDGVVDHVHPAQDAVKNGPADGMPVHVADHHRQRTAEGYAGFRGPGNGLFLAAHAVPLLMWF